MVSSTRAWLGALVEAVDADPACRWTDEGLRALCMHPDRDPHSLPSRDR